MIELKELPFDVTYERVIEYLDGPLLSLWRNSNDEPYFKIWFDRKDGTDKYLFVRITDQMVKKYEKRNLTLLKIMTQPCDQFGFIIETVKGEIVNCHFLKLSEFPSDSLPSENSFHDKEFSKEQF